MRDEAINPGDEFGKILGFTSEKFLGYIWVKDEKKQIWLSAIISRQPGKGHLRDLIFRCWELEYSVHIPTPSAAMREIAEHYGFEQRVEWDEDMQDDLEIWVAPPPCRHNFIIHEDQTRCELCGRIRIVKDGYVQWVKP